MVDILVFSHSCLRRVNRLVFEEIAVEHNLIIHIVVPEYLLSGNLKILADEPTPFDKVKLIKRTLIGKSPRYYRFKSTHEVIKMYKPKLVLIDSDPASLQAVQIARMQIKHKYKLVALTCENQSLSLKDNYKRRGWKGLILTLPKHILLSISKARISHLFTINDLGYTIYKNLGFKSVSKIPLGFSPQVFKEDLESRKEIRNKFQIEGKFVFAYVGRIVKEKGIHILLKGLHQIKDFSNWVLLLDEFSEAENTYSLQINRLLGELSLKSRIVFFDASHADIFKYMNAADAIVIPSISSSTWIEQYGRVAPEALACGKLVIASKTGALPELIQDAGVLVEEGNISALSSILKQCVTNELIPAKFRQKAINRSGSLTIGEQARQMTFFFNKLLQDN